MVYLGIAAGIFILDFFIKRHMDKKYTKGKRHLKAGKRLFIEKYYNNGAMLNFLEKSPGILRLMNTVLLLLACIWFYFLLRMDGKTYGKLGAAFLIGGGCSNLFDRYTKGHVVDYFGFNIGPEWFRKIVFNVSDFFVFIGTALLLLGYGRKDV